MAPRLVACETALWNHGVDTWAVMIAVCYVAEHMKAADYCTSNQGLVHLCVVGNMEQLLWHLRKLHAACAANRKRSKLSMFASLSVATMVEDLRRGM